jgi:hypothetical protein
MAFREFSPVYIGELGSYMTLRKWHYRVENFPSPVAVRWAMAALWRQRQSQKKKRPSTSSRLRAPSFPFHPPLYFHELLLLQQALPTMGVVPGRVDPRFPWPDPVSSSSDLPISYLGGAP